MSKNYIPVKKTAVHKMLSLDKENVPNKWHRSLGRKRRNDVDKIATDVFNVLNSNVEITKKDQEIETTLKDNAKNASERTKKRCSNEVKIRAFLSNKHSVKNKVRVKTMSQHAAENSSRSDFSFAATVVSTQTSPL